MTTMERKRKREKDKKSWHDGARHGTGSARGDERGRERSRETGKVVVEGKTLFSGSSRSTKTPGEQDCHRTLARTLSNSLCGDPRGHPDYGLLPQLESSLLQKTSLPLEEAEVGEGADGGTRYKEGEGGGCCLVGH